MIFARGNFSNLPIHIRGPSRDITSSGIDEQLSRMSEPQLPTAHPVYFARKLIMLALCLHGLDRPVYDAAEHYFNIASQHVHLARLFNGTLWKGVETLMLESCYHINIGNTRRAWLVSSPCPFNRATPWPPFESQGLIAVEKTLCGFALSWEIVLFLGFLVFHKPSTKMNSQNDQDLTADRWTAKLERIHAVVMGPVSLPGICACNVLIARTTKSKINVKFAMTAS